MPVFTEARYDDPESKSIRCLMDGRPTFFPADEKNRQYRQFVALGATCLPYPGPAPSPSAADEAIAFFINQPAMKALGKALAEKFGMTPAAFLALIKSKVD